MNGDVPRPRCLARVFVPFKLFGRRRAAVEYIRSRKRVCIKITDERSDEVRLHYETVSGGKNDVGKILDETVKERFIGIECK